VYRCPLTETMQKPVEEPQSLARPPGSEVEPCQIDDRLQCPDRAVAAEWEIVEVELGVLPAPGPRTGWKVGVGGDQGRAGEGTRQRNLCFSATRANAVRLRVWWACQGR